MVPTFENHETHFDAEGMIAQSRHKLLRFFDM
jgi:hypothetical protein